MTVRAGTAKGSAARVWSTLLVLLIAVGVALPAFAQERPQRRGLFQFLFGGEIRRVEPERPIRQPEVRKRPRTQRQTVGGAGPAPRSEPKVVAAEKAADAKVVLVAGDFIASGLSEALSDVYAENPGVRVLGVARGSSGFVRDDHYDWPGSIGAIIDEQKPAVVVMMIGANDRQEMRTATGREPKRSEAWVKEYEQRVGAFARQVRDRGIPLVWVGMVPFKSTSMSADMIALNDIFQTSAEDVGGVFVDVWDGFVDESGAFVSTGPDINGQPVRLRQGENGINLTAAGKRKVAFYAEKPLQKILGITEQGTAAPGIPMPDATPKPAGPIDRTPPISLSDPELDGGSELLGATVVPASETEAPPAAAPLAVGSAYVPGRADDFSGTPATATAAQPPADNRPTAAISR